MKMAGLFCNRLPVFCVIEGEGMVCRELRLKAPCDAIDGNAERIVAVDVVRFLKASSEGLKPGVTEHFVKLIVSAKSSKFQK